MAMCPACRVPTSGSRPKLGVWGAFNPFVFSEPELAIRLASLAIVRDAIALFMDIASDCFDVRIEPVLPRDLQGKVGRARKVRGEAEVLQREAAIASAEVAADLVQTAH